MIATALAGEQSTVLNVTAADLLAESEPVARTVERALARPQAAIEDHRRLHALLRRSMVYDDLVDALQSEDPGIRAAAARICGAARLTGVVTWLGDLVEDPDRAVREAAVRGLALHGGRRAVELLVASADTIPLYRLAIALGKAASDIDIEAQMRQPVSEHAAVATVMACGLRHDVLRISPLLGIAHDRRWPVPVRQAACKALAMIADRSAADGLARVADADPDPEMRKVAQRAHRRLLRRAVARRR